MSPKRIQEVTLQLRRGYRLANPGMMTAKYMSDVDPIQVSWRQMSPRLKELVDGIRANAQLPSKLGGLQKGEKFDHTLVESGTPVLGYYGALEGASLDLRWVIEGEYDQAAQKLRVYAWLYTEVREFQPGALERLGLGGRREIGSIDGVRPFVSLLARHAFVYFGNTGGNFLELYGTLSEVEVYRRELSEELAK